MTTLRDLGPEMVVDMQSLLRWTATVALLASSAAAQAQTQIPWASSLEQAQQAATEQRKLVLLHFYNDHCAPCERVEREVYFQPQVAEAIARNYIPVKIHAGQQPKIAEQFRVDRWPTDIISLPSGQEIMRTTSPQKPADYIGMVDQIAMRTGVGAARHWQSSMAAVGQTVLDPQVAQAQAVAGQAADAAQGYANQANNTAQGYANQAATTAQDFANQSTSTFHNYAQQANRWNQQASGATQQLGNSAQQLGNSAQQMGSLVQNTGRDVRSAWEAGAAAPAPQSSSMDSPYAQFAQPQAGSPPAVQPQTAQVPAAQPQLPLEPSLPTANPFIGAAPPQRAATAQSPPALATVQPGPQSAAPAEAAAPSAAPAAQPMGPLAGSPSPALTPDQGLVPASQAPPVAMEGYCPVTLLEQRKWKRSDPKYGAIHRGRTYLFSSEAEQQKFLANPDGYSPMLSGFDPVIFSQRGELVEGKRSYGLTYNKQIFLFADEGSLQAFSKSPHAFAQQAHQAMNQAETGSKLR